MAGATGRATQVALAAAAIERAPTHERWREAGAALDAALSGPEAGLLLPSLRGSSQLAALLPELAVCDGFDQRSPYHPEGDLYTHIEGVVARIAKLSPDPDLRWAALLHDLGKPESFWVDEAGHGHFYASAEHGTEDHEEIGAHMAGPILARFGIREARSARITHIVRHHMFAGFDTMRTARRFLRRVGDDHTEALLIHRQADWEHDGDPAAEVARMRRLVERARTEPDPVSVSALTIGGGILIAEFGMSPGPAVGQLLGNLRAEVEAGQLADEPETLLARARELLES